MRFQASIEYIIILTIAMILYLILFREAFYYGLSRLYSSSFLSILKTHLVEVVNFFSLRFEIGKFQYFEPEVITFSTLKVEKIWIENYPIDDYCSRVFIKVQVYDKTLNQHFNVSSDQTFKVCGKQLYDLKDEICNKILLATVFHGYEAKVDPSLLTDNATSLCNNVPIYLVSPQGTTILL